MLSPERARLLGRIGAHRLHATHDSRDVTAPARASFLACFERAVDPAGELTPEERGRRAGHARRAHFLQLALRSADLRRARREGASE